MDEPSEERLGRKVSRPGDGSDLIEVGVVFHSGNDLGGVMSAGAIEVSDDNLLLFIGSGHSRPAILGSRSPESFRRRGLR
jgi:hypothetical protein